jgi:lipopolysaccharide export system protein LptA
MKGILTGSLILFVFSLLAIDQTEVRPYRLVNADTVRAQKINDEYVTRLFGNVNFFYGDTEFYADQAVIYEVQKITQMQGNVKVFEDTLSLFSDQAEYFRFEEKLLLQGNVLAQEIHADSTIRTFAAEEIEYLREERTFTALRQVKAYDEREALNGSCERLKYFIDDGYGYLLENPEITMGSRDSMRLSAEKIEYFEDFQKIAANFNVITSSSEFTINSDFLLFFNRENKAIYLGEPHFRSEFAAASANEFLIIFADSTISQAQLLDYCRVDFKTEDQIEKNNWITADQMDFDFKQGKINICEARGQVESYFQQESSEQRDYLENLVTGEFLYMVIENNEIINISMKEKVQGVYKFQQK